MCIQFECEWQLIFDDCEEISDEVIINDSDAIILGGRRAMFHMGVGRKRCKEWNEYAATNQF